MHAEMWSKSTYSVIFPGTEVTLNSLDNYLSLLLKVEAIFSFPQCSGTAPHFPNLSKVAD